MSTAHHRITEALDRLSAGLCPFVESELKAFYRDNWIAAARDSFRDDRGTAPKGEVIRWDAASLLTVMWDQWNRVFRNRLGQPERSLVSELRDYRNRWAHQARFDFDDSYRVLDSIERLLRAVGAATEADQIARSRRDLLRQEFSREIRAAYQKSQANRRKLQDMLLYAVCGASILFALFQALDSTAWLLSVFVVLAFTWLAWNRLSSSQPVFFGAHECVLCGKIIYSASCPYCEPEQFRPAPRVPATEQKASPEGADTVPLPQTD